MTAIENGSTAIHMQGCNMDDEVRKGHWEVVSTSTSMRKVDDP